MVDLSKRYLVFSGAAYYPGGGMTDCIGSVDSLEEGSAMLAEDHFHNWSHLFDTIERVTIDPLTGRELDAD